MIYIYIYIYRCCIYFHHFICQTRHLPVVVDPVLNHRMHQLLAKPRNVPSKSTWKEMIHLPGAMDMCDMRGTEPDFWMICQ